MRVYTEATPRLIELHKNYKGNKFGNSDYAVWFDNTNTKDETGFFTATDGDSEDYWKLRNYTYLSEQEFIEFMELEETVKEVFNPQSHYDNSKGSLYKVATERNWNAYIFDVVKRLERGGKKDPLKQEIEKSIDVLKIWLAELK